MQMLADVLGVPVETREAEEASSRGAALMAAEALGWLPSALEAPPPRSALYTPDPHRHARHAEARDRHEVFYRRLVLEAEPGP
jgi:gluconokinase